MTFHVIDASNSIVTGGSPALALDPGDHLLVQFDGSIVATSVGGTAVTCAASDNSTITVNGLIFGGNAGIRTDSANTQIVVNGTVVSGGTGILASFNSESVRITVNGTVTGDTFGISVDSHARIHVGQNGEVSGGDAVKLNGFSTLINDGTVNGIDDNAVNLISGSLFNNGVISSFFNAITYGGEGLSFITNTGTIQGNLTTADLAPAETSQLLMENSGTWQGNLELSAGADRLTNTGSITGNVQLGDGFDRLESRNGSIFGDVTGGGGNDFIRTGAEDNTISGGAGGDVLDGGGGINTLNYGSSLVGVAINLIDGTARFGEAAGDRFSNFQNVTGSLLNDTLIGDGRDNTLFGLVGRDTLTGNDGNDSLLSYGTGTSTISGGGGNDFVQLVSADIATFGSAFSAANRIDGGSGFDTLELTNTGTVVLANQTVVNIEAIVVQDGFSYGLTTRDATVAAGRTLTVDASLTGANKLDFDGSAETDGAFDIDGGAGKDTFTGGAGADRMAGGGRGDVLTGGAGADVFVYNGLTDSKGVTYDTISDFNAAGVDKLDLDIAVTGFDPTQNGDVSSGTLVSDLQTVVGGNLDASHAILVNATGGSLNGRLFLLIDGNGNDGYQQNGDYLIDVTGMTGTLSLDDFV